VGVLLSGWKNARKLAFMANGSTRLKTATEDRRFETGRASVGQVMGLLHDEPTVAELDGDWWRKQRSSSQKLDAHFS